MISIRKLCFVWSTQRCFKSEELPTDLTLNTSAITQGKAGFREIDKNPEPLKLTDAVQFKRLCLTIIEAESLPVGRVYEIDPDGLRSSLRKRRDGRTYAGYEESTNDIVLPRNEFGVGSVHFVVEYNSLTNQYLIKDEGEGTGTFAKVTRPLPLQTHYILSFGSTHMTVILSDRDPQTRLTVKFVEGPKAGQSYLFDPSDKVIKIGRMPDCTIKFEDTSLSRYQCTIRFQDNAGWIVEDGDGAKGSTNGTWLFLDDYFTLESGMVIKVGMTLLESMHLPIPIPRSSVGIMDLELIRLRNELSKLKREDALQSMLTADITSKLEEAKKQLEDYRQQIPKSKLAAEGMLTIETEDCGEIEDRPENSNRTERHSITPALVSTKRVHLLKGFFLGESKRDSEWEVSRYVPPSCWEYVFVLPNPDHPSLEPKAIKERDAMRIFQLCFRGEEGSSYQQTQRNFTIEMKAFKAAFQQLEDCKEGKKYCGGGRLVPDEACAFTDTLSPPKDFLTLMRNVLMVKLTQHLGLTARQILSSDGSRIFIVMYGSEADYQNEALRSSALTQLSISMIDLMGLEPCDDLMRPLRAVQAPEFIKRAINDLVIAVREAVVNDEKENYAAEFLNAGMAFGQSYEAVGITSAHWETYYDYLLMCTVAVRKLREIPLPLSYRYLFLEKVLKKMKNKANIKASVQAQILNLWDRLHIKWPIGPYTSYTQSINPITKEDSFAPFWRSYRIDEIGHRSQFRKATRLKLLFSLLNRQVVLHQLMKLELLPDHFALHDDWELSGTERISSLEDYNYLMIISKFTSLFESVFQETKHRIALRQAWGDSFFRIDLPIEKIRNYFGEKIGLFFTFKSLLARFLLVPSVVGLAVLLIKIFGNDQTTYMLAVDAGYCYFLSVWASLYLEYWIRKQNLCAVRWGTADYEEDEDTRPQFEGELRRSSVTDDMDEPYYDPARRRCKIFTGFLISGFMILIVLGIVAVLTVVRWKIANQLMVLGYDAGGPLISIVNAVQIQIFNIVYSHVALNLTDMENHKAQSEYESSFILKNYIFQFVNSFNSLYYVAFAKTYVEGCIYEDSSGESVKKIGASCIVELRTQLTTLFLVAYLKEVLLILLPYWNFKQNLSRLRKVAVEMKAERWKLAGLHDTRVIRDEVEEQYILNPYMTLGVDGTFQDYMSITIMFGYVTLFGLAFPLSSLLICLLLLLEIRINKLKMLNLTRRPQPIAAKDIGVWWDILQLTAVSAIFTNAGLFCFTQPTFEGLVDSSTLKFIPFGIMSISLLIIRTWVQGVIPDVPTKYNTLHRRHQHIVNRFIRSRSQVEAKADKSTVSLNYKVYCPDSLSTEMD